MTTTDPGYPSRAAACSWIGAATLYLVAEAIAAAGFPGYSYAENYISDLGVPGPDSRWSVIMNVGFIGHGLLLLLGTVLRVRAGDLGSRLVPITLGVCCAVGMVLVGTVHSGRPAADNGTAFLHVLGAAAAIIAGNLLAIAAGRASRRVGAPTAYRVASTALGTVGLLSLAMLLVDGSTTAFTVLPDGAWERASVYTIQAWELMTGIAILLGARRARRRTSRPSTAEAGTPERP